MEQVVVRMLEVTDIYNTEDMSFISHNLIEPETAMQLIAGSEEVDPAQPI